MPWKTVDVPLESESTIVGFEEFIGDANGIEIIRNGFVEGKSSTQKTSKQNLNKIDGTELAEKWVNDNYSKKNDPISKAKPQKHLKWQKKNIVNKKIRAVDYVGDQLDKESNEDAAIKSSKRKQEIRNTDIGKRTAVKRKADSDSNSERDCDNADLETLKKKKYVSRSQVVDMNSMDQVKRLQQKETYNSTSAKPMQYVEIKYPKLNLSKLLKELPKWSDLQLPVELLAGLKDRGFTNPTEIQKQSIPAALIEYRDVIAAAETGSGKTMAYGLPVLGHILGMLKKDREEQKDSSNFQRPLALVLVPTRELGVQVKQHLDAICSHCQGIQTGLIVGGLSVAKQQRVLSQRPVVLVATPGRLWQLVKEKAPGLENIASIRYLVVDEADRIVEKAHFRELKMLVKHINNNQTERQKRQTLLFSATLTFAQYDIEKRATDVAVLQDKLRNLMEELAMKNRPKIIDLSPAGTTSRRLVEAKVVCEGGDVEKDTVLYAILSQYPGRTLVFANAIETVRKISNILKMLFAVKKNGKVTTSRPIMLLHAQLRQRNRLKYLDKFRDEPNAILVASDVAARGLDIANIEHVIHYHVPTNTESYVHRSGRTARVSSEGLSILLVDPKVEAGRFWRLMANLCRKVTSEDANINDVPDFDVDNTLLHQCRQRIKVCKQLEALQHQMKKIQAGKKFSLETRKELVDSSSSSSSSSESSDEEGEQLYEGSLKAKQRQLGNDIKVFERDLRHLLASPLKVGSKIAQTKYPTSMGQALSLESTLKMSSGRNYETDRAIQHIVDSRSKVKQLSLAKKVALASKIEKRKAKLQQKNQAKVEERKRIHEEKRKLKRKKKEDKEKAVFGDKEFIIY